LSLRATAVVATLILAVGATASAGSLKGTVKAAGRNVTEAVVYVDAIPGKTFPSPSAHAKIDQKDMEFVPHVLVVMEGTAVDFLNSDPVLHNVFSPDKCAEKFNLGTWPQKQIRSYTFKRPCIATLLCNVHPEMEAFVVTVSTPYFSITDKNGSYEISDIPDGTYDVRIWHPKRKAISQKITISGDTSSDFTLK